MKKLNNKVINKLLYLACSKFVKNAIRIIKEYTEEFGITPIEFASGSLNLPLPDFILSDKLLGYHYDVNNLYEVNKDRIEDIPEFQKCKNLMKKDSVIQKHIDNLVGNRVMRQRIEVEEYLRLITVMVVREVTSFNFRKQIFDKIFIGMENFFHSDKLVNSSLVLIENFECKQNEIKLEKDVSIIKLPEWKRLNLWYNLPKIFKHKLIDTIKNSKHAIQVLWDDNKIIGKIPKPASSINISEKIDKTSYKVISALRIFKKGSIYQGTIIPGLLMGDLLTGGALVQPEGKFIRRQEYLLSKDEIVQFKNFWKKFKLLYRKNYFKIGIKRFNYSYKKGYNLEDRIIDYFIAFESLFLTGSQELTYKLAMRVSFFLGKNEQERKKIFEIMKSAYNIRSKIVHGKDIKKNLKELEKKFSLSFHQFISLIEDYVRQSLQKIVAIGYISHWDKLILECKEKHKTKTNV